MRLFTIFLVTACCSVQVFAQDRTDLGDVPIQSAITSDTTDQAGSDGAAQTPQNAGQQPGPPAPTHPTATTYSDAYELRLKIHKYASYATLPLFATELALGESIYSNPDSGAKKGIHGAVGAGIIGLFGVNGVTGIWNLWESRHDENGRKLRIVHSVLMLAASGGFVATWATAPSTHNVNTPQGLATFDNNRVLHRNLAISSIGVGTAGYLIMLFKGK
jgi:hypothetical protein